jgi:hypothetical protein
MRYFIYLILMVSTTLSAGTIQKWVDENGNVHYGDAPPVSAKTEKVRVQSAPSNPGKKLPRLNDDNGQQGGAEQTAGQNNQMTGTQAKEACERARADMLVIESNSRIRLRQPDGSTRYLTEAEIAERRAMAQEDIDNFCK